MALKRKGAKQSKKLQPPVKMAAARKEEELFPQELGVASPAGSFLPMIACLIHLWGPYTLQATGQTRSAGLGTSKTHGKVCIIIIGS